MFKLFLATTAATLVTGKQVTEILTDEASIFDIKQEIWALKQKVADIAAGVDNADMGNQASVAAMAASIRVLSPSISRVDALVEKVSNLGADTITLKANVYEELHADRAKSNAHVSDIQMEASKKKDEIMMKITGMKKVAQVLTDYDATTLIDKSARMHDRLASSHYADGTRPVFRWTQFSTYAQQCCWIDDNNNRAFGGVNPQQWGDANYRADQMSSDMKVLKRLFSKKVYGDREMGANVCIDQFIMPHSTDDRACGALFRIKNTGSMAKTWAVGWTFTGWSGWGNQASVAMRKQNVWNGDCYHFCERTEQLSIRAGTTETIIFKAGGGADSYYNGVYSRTLFLGFNNLKLPDGLHFADDLDTEFGAWA